MARKKSSNWCLMPCLAGPKNWQTRWINYFVQVDEQWREFLLELPLQIPRNPSLRVNILRLIGLVFYPHVVLGMSNV